MRTARVSIKEIPPPAHILALPMTFSIPAQTCSADAEHLPGQYLRSDRVSAPGPGAAEGPARALDLDQLSCVAEGAGFSVRRRASGSAALRVVPTVAGVAGSPLPFLRLSDSS